jgi:hypothetical protein
MPPEKVLLLVAFCSAVTGGGVFFFAYQRWYIPLSSRLTVERRRREEAKGVPPSPRDYEYAISFDDAGFTVTNLRNKKAEPFGMKWAEICQVRAFKRDLFAVDCICLFLARADGIGIELDEEMARWNTFVKLLPQHLEGCKAWDAWFSAVAFPAFVPNETEIYVRPKSQPV